MFDVIDRRRFLEVAASTSLAFGVSAQADTAAATATNARLVVGIMGTGSRGTEHARTFAQQPGVEVAYVCDVDRGRAEHAAGEVDKLKGKAPRAVQDFRHVLDDKAVDVLVVATCNHWHAPAAIL